MRRCRIPGDNVVRLLHSIAFHPATHQQSSKSNHYVISLGDTRSYRLFVLRRHEVRSNFDGKSIHPYLTSMCICDRQETINTVYIYIAALTTVNLCMNTLYSVLH